MAYRLTDLGVRFVAPARMLYGWGRENADVLDRLGERATSRRRAPERAAAADR